MSMLLRSFLPQHSSNLSQYLLWAILVFSSGATRSGRLSFNGIMSLRLGSSLASAPAHASFTPLYTIFRGYPRSTTFSRLKVGTRDRGRAGYPAWPGAEASLQKECKKGSQKYISSMKKFANHERPLLNSMSYESIKFTKPSPKPGI